MHHSSDLNTTEYSTVRIVSQQIDQARLAQSVERKALNLVVVGSSPTVGSSQHWASAWQARHAARPLSHVLADSCTEKTRPASSVCPHWVCPQHWASACPRTELGYKRHIVRACGQSSQARPAQSAERKALNLVVVGLSPTVGVCLARRNRTTPTPPCVANRIARALRPAGQGRQRGARALASRDHPAWPQRPERRQAPMAA